MRLYCLVDLSGNVNMIERFFKNLKVSHSSISPQRRETQGSIPTSTKKIQDIIMAPYGKGIVSSYNLCCRLIILNSRSRI